MTSLDLLRPPLPLDPTAAAYKEWLHVNVLDHESGAIGLVNASLHGDPLSPRARALGTALVHLPDRGWIGNAEVRGADEARLGIASIALEQVAVAIDHQGAAALASARLPAEPLSATVRARFGSEPVHVEMPLPLGSGWIAWYVVPRLEASGELVAGGHAASLRHASVYHDHNWGRWFWGDDFGWEWGAFLSPGSGPAFVLARTTNRHHTTFGPALLVADTPAGRRTFGSEQISIAFSGRLDTRLRRVPGALAALHGDRANPGLPARLEVDAADGADHVRLRFDARAAAQLIAGDPMRRGYTFLHELVGAFSAEGTIGGTPCSCSGLAVVEYVD